MLAGLREVSHVHSRWTIASVGVAALGVAAAMVWFSLASVNGLPTDRPYVVHAALRDATGLYLHAQVREDGRLVGQVLNPRIEKGLPVVTLQLEGDTKRLPVDSRAHLRAQSALGMAHVELRRGASGATVPNGGRLRLSEAGTFVPVQRFLATLDPRTRRRTQELLDALGTGFADRGRDLNTALAAAPGAVRDARSVADAVLARRGAAADAVRGTAQAMAALDRARRDIARGLDPARRALAPFGARAGSVADALDVAPDALRDVRAGLAKTDPLLDELGGLLRTALPALERSPEALRESASLLKAGRTALPGSVSTLELAERAAPPTLALLRATDPVLPRLTDLAGGLLPLVETAARHRCDVERFLANWASLVSVGNAGGNYVRVLIALPTLSSVGGQRRHLGPLREHRNPYPAPCSAVDDRVGGSR